MRSANWLIMFDEATEPNVIWDRAVFAWRTASELELKEARENDPRYFRIYPMDIYRMDRELDRYKHSLKTPEQLKEESADRYFDEEYQ